MNQPPPRVRVTGPRHGRPRRSTVIAEIDEQTVVGDIYIRSLMRKKDLADELLKGLYADPAIIPASPWLVRQRPARPQVTIVRAADGATQVTLTSADKKAWLWAIQGRYGDTWKLAVISASQQQANLGVDEKLGVVNQIAITAIDRVGNASVPFVATITGRVMKPLATQPAR